MRFHSRPPSSMRSFVLCAAALTATITGIYLIEPPLIGVLNDRIMDLAMNAGERSAPSGSVAVVEIDDKSLSRYGQWPWPRTRLAHLLEKINAMKPGTICLNAILAEPDRTSPNEWRTMMSNEIGGEVSVSGVPDKFLDHDRYLSDELSRGRFVLGCRFLLDRPSESASPGPHSPVSLVTMDSSGGGSAPPAKTRFFAAKGVIAPTAAFSSVPLGFLNATPDSDGVLRRLPTLIEYNGRLYPSMALAALMQFKQRNEVVLHNQRDGGLSLRVADIEIPIDSQANAQINFGGARPLPRFSAVDVMDGRLREEDVRGRIVLVGASGAGLSQSHQNSADLVTSDLNIHARAIEAALTGAVVLRPFVAPAWEALIGAIVAFLLCIATARMRLIGGALTSCAAVVLLWAGTTFLFRDYGLLLSPLLPTTLILANCAAMTAWKITRSRNEAREKEREALILLKASENRLDSILKAIPDVIFRVDLQAHITYISHGISKHLGSPQDLSGASLPDLFVPDDREKVRAALFSTSPKGAHPGELPQELEVRLQSPPGQESSIFSLSVQGVYRESRLTGVQGVLRDIGERKRLESQLSQAKKMKLIGDLAAGVAHDLNNILTGLVSYPELLLMDLPDDSPARETAMVIQQSGRKAAAIVQDLLTLARSGVRVKEVIDLNAVVSDYLKSPEHRLREQENPRIVIEVALAQDLMRIKGGPHHLSKALMNLLNNAAEAMPKGGRIRISTCNKYVDVPLSGYERIPEGEYVCLSVEDEGVGISADDMERIFEPFYTKKRMQRSGTGLGTTIIWNTVKDHGGYIDLQSREGEGARIDLYIPATRELADDATRSMTLDDYLGAEHILIVDDMPQQIEIASRMLTKLGYKVSTASSGEEAVELIRRTSPDLLVLDMVMPGGMDGFETYERAIAIRPGQKAIITSGYSESERVRMLQQIGAGPYVQKPYTLESIGVAIRRELDRRAGDASMQHRCQQVS